MKRKLLPRKRLPPKNKEKRVKEMDLEAIRKNIDEIDDELAILFEKRSQLACQVAEYKKANNMQVFQKGREDFILDRVEKKSSPEMKNASRLLFQTIMDISKCRQQQLLTEVAPFNYHSCKHELPKVGAVTKGSYTADACKKFFGKECEIEYFRDFNEVFEAVEQGRADYGVLPIENSTAGDVSATYDLMGKHNFYIYKSTKIKIDHVLAVKKGMKLSDVKTVISHEMAIKQCSQFIGEKGYSASPRLSTAGAAEEVANSNPEEGLAAICSRSCAELFGLEAVASDIVDIKDNYTRFIMISKKLQVTDNASVISLSLSLPHTPGSLYRMLTRFAYCGLNLCRIESKPMPSSLADVKDDAFDFIFYLDFYGNIENEDVIKLLANLKQESKYYRFLGNYEEIE